MTEMRETGFPLNLLGQGSRPHVLSNELSNVTIYVSEVEEYLLAI